MLIFTAIYNVATNACLEDPLCSESLQDTSPSLTAFTFVPREGESVVAQGKVARGELRWIGTNDGTYVYFGLNQPIEGAQFVSVVDGGMPAWLLAQTNALISRALALYTERTGQPLGFNPVIYVSYGKEASPNSQSYGGGALPGVLQLETRLGAKFQGEHDPEVAERSATLVLHEAAHLWNSQLNQHRGDGEGWLHEGSADAFAHFALLQLGLIAEARYAQIISSSISRCLLSLGKDPLKPELDRDNGKPDYWCGEAIAFWTWSATRRAAPSVDLISFWGKLYAAPDHTYDQALYDKTLAAFPGGAAVVAGIHRLIDGPVAGTDQLLLDSLKASGVNVRANANPTDGEYQRLLGKHTPEQVAARPLFLEVSAPIWGQPH